MEETAAHAVAILHTERVLILNVNAAGFILFVRRRRNEGKTAVCAFRASYERAQATIIHEERGRRDRAAGYPTHEQISIARYRGTRAIPGRRGRRAKLRQVCVQRGGKGQAPCVCVSRCARATARKIVSKDGYGIVMATDVSRS